MTACLALCVSLLPAGASPERWSDTARGDPAMAASVAICRSAEKLALPTAPQAPAPADCDSAALLAGIGTPADPGAARVCALREMADGNNATGGAATLATIYANGSGVPRDYPVALGYACRIDGAPAEMDARVKHLARLGAHGPDPAPFDLCDDVTSGMLGGYCSERAAAVADVRRTRELAELTAGLPPASCAAYRELRRAEERFAKAAAENEVDTSGTGRASFIIDSEQAHADDFVSLLRQVLIGTVRAPGGAGDSDRRLNAAYTAVMATRDTSGWGTVGRAGIRTTQRAWLAYRDAMLAFAAVAAPRAAQEALADVLTAARTKELDAFR